MALKPSIVTSLLASCWTLHLFSAPFSLLCRKDTRTFPTSTRSSRRRSRSWRRRGRPGTWRTPISCSSKTSRTWQTGAELNMTLFSFERTQFTTENNKQQCHLWFLKKTFTNSLKFFNRPCSWLVRFNWPSTPSAALNLPQIPFKWILKILFYSTCLRIQKVIIRNYPISRRHRADNLKHL